MGDRFPNVREVQKRYRTGAPSLRYPRPDGVAAGTLGTALDWRVRFLLDPHPDAHLAIFGAVMVGNQGLVDALEPLVRGAQMRVDVGTDHQADVGPLPERDEALVVPLCWVLALCTEVYRSGLWPGSPLDLVGPKPTPQQLLALAPASACLDISMLARAAKKTLLPVLEARGGDLFVGPTFAGSRLIGGADADVCAGGLLVDVKTTSGARRKGGQYECSLDRVVLRQLLGYLLLDFDDAHAIERIGVYAARFDYLTEWDLEELLTEIGGGPPDLQGLRDDFRALLESLPRAEVGDDGD
jgi:hypothetical protein